MIQQVKPLAVNPDSQSSMPGTHLMEKEVTTKVVL